MDGGNRRSAGESETEGLGDGGHGGSRPHCHTVTGAGGDVIFEILPVLAGKISSSAFSPILPDIGSRGEGLAAPRGSHHCSAGHKDNGKIDHRRSHEEGRDRFVTSSHENSSIDGMGAQRFLDLHGKEIAIEHRGGLHESLAETHHGHFHGIAAGLPDAAFDLLGTLAKVRVARKQIVPGIKNRDDGLALIFLIINAQLLVAGTVTKGAKIIGTEETVRAELFGSEAAHRRTKVA